jgi:Uma2 family endonuclease
MQTATIDRSKQWTVDDFLKLEESNLPCELINGELIMSPSPVPIHQIISGNLYDILKAYAKKTGSIVFFAPMDLYINHKNVFQPDLIYISKERKDIITNRGVEGIPDLIVEIISPSNVFTDRNRKKKTYQEIGVGEYWIIDPAHQTCEIYQKDQTDKETPALYLVGEGIVTSSVLPGLEFNLKDIF